MLVLQVLVLNFVSLVMCSARITYFETFRNQEPVTKTVLNIISVRNIMKCASFCSEMEGCLAFLFADVSMECELLDTNNLNNTDLIPGISTFAMLHTSSANVSTTSDPVAMATTSDPVATIPTSDPVATTTTLDPVGMTTPANSVATTPTSVPIGPMVIDIVYGASMMCSDTSSSGPNDDLLVLTTAGVYIYDSISELAVGPCNGPLEFTTVFHDMPGLPSTPSNVRGLSFTGTNIELYADDNRVYIWTAADTFMSPFDQQNYRDHLGSNFMNGVDFILASVFDPFTPVMLFDLGNDTVCAAMPSPSYAIYDCFIKQESYRYLSLYDVNLFKNAPDNVIAADITNGTNVVFIDSSGNVYEGEHHTINFVPFGKLQF